MNRLELEMKRAELAKMKAETDKIKGEAFWYPVVVAAGLMGAGAALATAIIKLFQ